MNRKKWYDFFFLLIGLLAITITYFFYTDYKKNDLNDTENLVVMGVISEGDCVGCIEDVICNWQNLKDRLSQIHNDISFKLYFAVLDSQKFDNTQLEDLCVIPKELSIVSLRNLTNYRRYPGRTPAIIIFLDNKIVSQIPIIPGTGFDETLVLLEDHVYNLQ